MPGQCLFVLHDFAALVCGDETEGEAVVPLSADGLDNRGRDARLRGQQLIELPHALHPLVAAVWVGNRSLAHYIISDNLRAAARELHRPFEIFRV